MAGNTVGSLAEAFACAGGSFRMLLPVLLMPVRDGDPVSFRQLSRFADILVPERRCKSMLSPIATSNSTDIGPSILSSTGVALKHRHNSDAQNMGLFLENRGLESLNWIFLRSPSNFLSLELWKACQKFCLAILSTLVLERGEELTGSIRDWDLFEPEPIHYFKLAVNLLLFDLKVWPKSSFRVHGRILSDMHQMVTSDLHVASSVDVQSYIDSLTVYVVHHPNYAASSSCRHTESLDDLCALRSAAFRVSILEVLILQHFPNGSF